MRLIDEWDNVLSSEVSSFPFIRLMRGLVRERQAGVKIYPSEDVVFRALNECPPQKVKVVILGQDPYHTENTADGLAFSCVPDRANPPSLRNIFKELSSDLMIATPNHGSLLKWAKQGVLLLNSVMTVEDGKPGSHRERGWERFTDAVISYLNKQKTPKVFMLWGMDAVKKEVLLNNPRHLVIKSTHPSPFSAHVSTGKFEPFMGSKPFSRANKFLVNNDIKPIDWPLPDML